MALGLGLGLGFRNGEFGSSSFDISSFIQRVEQDGGTFEAQECFSNPPEDAFLSLTANAYKAGKLYSFKPFDGSGDFNVVRNTIATRVNQNGIIETVATNVPRLDYSNSECPVILVEPQRTNLVFPSAVATTQTRTVTAVAHTLSFYGTGTVTLSGVAVSTLNGTGVNNRVMLTFTPTAGSLTLTVSGDVRDWQLEAGANATSLIITSGGMVTRNADIITCTIADEGIQLKMTREDNVVVYDTLTSNYQIPNGRWKSIVGAPRVEHLFEYNSTTSLNLGIQTLDGSPVTAEWGDGTSSVINSSLDGVTRVTKNFTVAQRGTVRLITTSVITAWNSTVGTWRFNIANLPIGLTYYLNSGSNTTTGNIANLPIGLTYYQNEGLNTTTGNIANLPIGLTVYLNSGSNTTTGNIDNLPVGLTVYLNAGLNTTTYSLTTGRTWANSQNRHIVRASNLTTQMVDNYLIDLSTQPNWIGSRLVDIRGNAQPRSSASNAAVALLQSYGVTVITN